jgi:hypothetical protein
MTSDGKTPTNSHRLDYGEPTQNRITHLARVRIPIPQLTRVTSCRLPQTPNGSKTPRSSFCNPLKSAWLYCVPVW